jgi:hypothetical protein
MGFIEAGAETPFRRLSEVPRPGSRGMTARRRKQSTSESTSSVYLDRDAVGSIVVKNGQVTGYDADGRRLGVYRTGKEAMSAIIAEARGRAA